MAIEFYTLTKLQGSQTDTTEIYTTLTVLHSYKITRFSNKNTVTAQGNAVLHSYKITRFSNGDKNEMVNGFVLHSYKITRFSN